MAWNSLGSNPHAIVCASVQPFRAVAVEAEVRGKAVKPSAQAIERARSVDYLFHSVTHHRDGREVTLRGERLRVDHEPRLPLAAEDVSCVEIFVPDDELSLCRAELPQRVDRRVEQAPLERTPVFLPLPWQFIRPAGCDLRKTAHVAGRWLPQAREQPGDDVPGRVVVGLEQRRARHAALDEQRSPSRVVGVEQHRAVAVPDAERVGLVLALLLRRVELQHDLACRDDE